MRGDYAQSAEIKGIVIVGHVTIPYSGTRSDDGHFGTGGDDPWNHQGAWPADMMYGEMNTGVWDGATGQDNLTVASSYFPANWNYPNDQKYDQDTNPGDLELFVGRIDFANLPWLNTSTAPSLPEAQLISQYVTKNAKYRSKAAAFRVEDRGIVHGEFWPATTATGKNLPGYKNLRYLFESAFPAGSVTHAVADPLLRSSQYWPDNENTGALWGFLSRRVLAYTYDQRFPELGTRASRLVLRPVRLLFHGLEHDE